MGIGDGASGESSAFVLLVYTLRVCLVTITPVTGSHQKAAGCTADQSLFEVRRAWVGKANGKTGDRFKSGSHEPGGHGFRHADPILKLCHPERSISIRFANRDTKSKDPCNPTPLLRRCKAFSPCTRGTYTPVRRL